MLLKSLWLLLVVVKLLFEVLVLVKSLWSSHNVAFTRTQYATVYTRGSYAVLINNKHLWTSWTCVGIVSVVCVGAAKVAVGDPGGGERTLEGPGGGEMLGVGPGAVKVVVVALGGGEVAV